MAEHVHFHSSPETGADSGIGMMTMLLILVAVLAIGGFAFYALAYAPPRAGDADTIQIELPTGNGATNNPPSQY